MRKTTKHASLPFVIGMLGAVAANVGSAQALEDFSLHGFGSQTYYQTSANTYMGADHRGTWDNNFLGLIGTFAVNDKTTVWSQLETSSTATTHFTWFFINYQLSDDSQVDAGRVKMPVGIYNEITDTTFLQQSALLPAIYQNATNWLHDAYNGVGYDYTQHLGDAGKILWQVYGGDNDDTDPPADGRDRRVYGGRITYTSSVDGLRFMLSGNRAQIQIQTIGLLSTPPTSYLVTVPIGSLADQDLWIASVDYVHDDWDLKSEYGKQKYLGISADSYYLQAARNFAARWTVFARYDYVTTDKARSSDESFSQKVLAVGLNFKVRSNLSLRIEEQFNRGYALPVASGEVVPGTGTDDWSLFIAGVHFIF